MGSMQGGSKASPCLRILEFWGWTSASFKPQWEQLHNNLPDALEKEQEDQPKLQQIVCRPAGSSWDLDTAILCELSSKWASQITTVVFLQFFTYFCLLHPFHHCLDPPRQLNLQPPRMAYSPCFLFMKRKQRSWRSGLGTMEACSAEGEGSLSKAAAATELQAASELLSLDSIIKVIGCLITSLTLSN